MQILSFVLVIALMMKLNCNFQVTTLISFSLKNGVASVSKIFLDSNLDPLVRAYTVQLPRADLTHGLK